jgi:hypothetical protein
MAQQSIWDILQNIQPPDRPPTAYEQAKADVAAFNANPRAYSDSQKMDIVARAKQLGLDYSKGSQGDVATGKEKALAFGGGALDAILFGILKDKWYSDTRTEKYKNAGKLAGTGISFLIPSGSIGVAGRLIGGAGKGAKAMLGTAKALGSYGKATKIIKVAAQANRYEDILSVAQKSVEIAKAAHKAGGTAETASQLKRALALLKSTKNALVPAAQEIAGKAIGWKETLAAVNKARQAATAAEYAKAALRLQVAARAAQNAGFEENEKPYENPALMQQYLMTLPGYQQQPLGN